MFNSSFIAAMNGVDQVGQTQCKTCNKIISFYGYIPYEFFCPNCGQHIQMNVPSVEVRKKYDKEGMLIKEE